MSYTVFFPQINTSAYTLHRSNALLKSFLCRFFLQLPMRYYARHAKPDISWQLRERGRRCGSGLLHAWTEGLGWWYFFCFSIAKGFKGRLNLRPPPVIFGGGPWYMYMHIPPKSTPLKPLVAWLFIGGNESKLQMFSLKNKWDYLQIVYFEGCKA